VTNEELLRKAVITTDALAAAGKLNPEQADKFIDFVLDETALKGSVRTIRVKTDWEINKIGVGARVAMPAAEAKDPGLRRGITTSKVTLNAKEVIVPFEIGDSFLEENIEGEPSAEHIVRLMATKAANELEELGILGDALGVAALESDLIEGGDAVRHVRDSYLALFDGYARLADGGSIFNAAGANIGLSIFGGMLRAMPTKFRKDPRRLRYLVSPDLEQLWRERVSTRGTALGDQAVQGDSRIKAFGVEMVPLPLLPFRPRVVEHVVLNGLVAATLRYQNLANAVVHLATLGNVPTAPYTAGVDYTLDAAAGTIVRIGGGGIADGATVKVTYDSPPIAILTHFENLLLAIGRDIRIEKDRDIFRRVNQYAITIKVGVGVEEAAAIVKARNLGTGI